MFLQSFGGFLGVNKRRKLHCRPLVYKSPPLKGLKDRMPARNSLEGGILINQGSTFNHASSPGARKAFRFSWTDCGNVAVRATEGVELLLQVMDLGKGSGFGFRVSFELVYFVCPS